MWELIEANKRKSFILFFSLFGCLVLVGYVIGFYAKPSGGGLVGIFIASFTTAGLFFISYFFGETILLSSSHAKEVTSEVHPMLFNVVEEMRIAGNLPFMPKVYIIDESAPNAFATGIHPDKTAVAVTVGLLTRLNRDELQGVVAHEMSHILNKDVLYMTLAATMLGGIQLLTETFTRGLWYSGSSRRFRSSRSSGRGGGGAAILIAVLVSILGVILAKIFYFALSRQREYLADASGVRLTRYPEGLASALEKIAGSGKTLVAANAITAPMFISAPLTQEDVGLANLSATHPPMDERIKILRAMTHGVGLSDYHKAYQSVKHESSPIPVSALQKEPPIPLRASSVETLSVESKTTDVKDTARELGDLMRVVNDFAFFTCLCGLKFKIPPNFTYKKLTCPRCGVVSELPFFGEIQKVSQGVSSESQQYTRRSSGWESLMCGCGRVIQLSPDLKSPSVKCARCGRQIHIQNVV